MLYIDATQLRMWLDCRESYRQAYVLNRATKKPAIARAFGIALHEGVEDFWSGKDFPTALARVMESLNNTYLGGATPDEMRKWSEMVGYAQDMLACYYDNVEYDESRIAHDIGNVPMVEVEWDFHAPFDVIGVVLCGRIDRLEVGPKLVDLKTASEIGKTWKADYKSQMLRDPGLALYDWYLCQIGHAPQAIELEVLIKPYRDKGTRLERISMPEIIAYRSRFEQQLKFTLQEIKHFHQQYAGMDPWPMNTNHACRHKYGVCDFLEGCNKGWSGKTLDKYKQREEHLSIRKEQLCQITAQPNL